MSFVKLALTFLATALVAFGVVVISVYLTQRRLQYFPTHFDARGQGRGEWKPWREQGEFLGYFREGNRPAFIGLVFHGNAGEALDRAEMGELFGSRAVVVLAEYPGYGARPGTPTEKALFHAAVEAYDRAGARWGLPVRVLGESLGSGVAAYLASHRDIERLGLISPFTSARDVAERVYPWLPVRWLMKDPFLSEFHLRNVRVPLHIAHGTEDDLVPHAMGKRLWENYLGPKAFTSLPGRGHDGLVPELLHSPRGESFRTFLQTSEPFEEDFSGRNATDATD